MRKFHVVSGDNRKHPDKEIKLPVRKTKHSAGYDFYSPIDVTILPDTKVLIWTDVKAEMGVDEVLEIYIRSSLAIKKGLELKNSVGILDCVPKGTDILTPTGNIKVENLFRSDKKEVILSFNEDSCSTEPDIISDMWIVKDKPLLKIELDNGYCIKIPEDKPLFTKRGWVKIKDLRKEDEVMII